MDSPEEQSPHAICRSWHKQWHVQFFLFCLPPPPASQFRGKRTLQRNQHQGHLLRWLIWDTFVVIPWGLSQRLPGIWPFTASSSILPGSWGSFQSSCCLLHESSVNRLYNISISSSWSSDLPFGIGFIPSVREGTQFPIGIELVMSILVSIMEAIHTKQNNLLCLMVP